jgi:hypothetical protein
MMPYPTEEEQRLRVLILDFLKSIAPPGTTILLNNNKCLEVNLCCDGHDPIMGYQCFSKPGHTGLCWDMNKGVDFQRYEAWVHEVRKKKKK